MRSIALFPCSYTDEARIIGELSNSLRLRVYTDEMLFSDISEQFGIPVEKLKKILFRRTPIPNRSRLEKDKYIDLVRCSLAARKVLSQDGCIFYGMHTSLLDTESDRALKVLVFDEVEGRVRRAMQQEGFSENAAGDFIIRHDEKVSGWTQYLFNEAAYAPSLYDHVVTYNNSKLLDIITQIIQRFHDFAYPLDPVQRPCDAPIPGMQYINQRINWKEVFQPENRQ
jgi:cytidylate kinase